MTWRSALSTDTSLEPSGEKDSCATVCLAMGCSLVLLAVLGGCVYFAMHFILWSVHEVYGVRCAWCDSNTLPICRALPLANAESVTLSQRVLHARRPGRGALDRIPG